MNDDVTCVDQDPIGIRHTLDPGLDAGTAEVLDHAIGDRADMAIRVAAGLALQAKLSFRDALAVVAVVRTGAVVLYTEALNDGQEILGVRISNPFAA